MSENGGRSPTSIYVGAVIAVVALSSIGIILRVMAVRRMRMAALQRQNALAPVYPQSPSGPNVMGRQSYYTPPIQPPRTYSGRTPQNWNSYSSPPEPAPPYQPPTSPPPASPRLNSPNTLSRPNTTFSPPPGPPPPASSIPPSAFPTAPPSFPVPHTSPPSSRALPHGPSLTPSATGTSAQSMSLVDRMREVQTLMLQIHNLEREPANSDNRAKIQELQRRVTELSDVSVADTEPAPAPPLPTPQVASTTGPPRQPPPYALDGRDD